MFDPYDAASTGQVVFKCNGATDSVTITLGQGQSGTFSTRTMQKSGESLPYNLYLNAAQTPVWGDGTGGIHVYFITNPLNNRDVIVMIYGKIPAGADVSAGTYSVTVAATISF